MGVSGEGWVVEVDNKETSYCNDCASTKHFLVCCRAERINKLSTPWTFLISTFKIAAWRSSVSIRLHLCGSWKQWKSKLFVPAPSTSDMPDETNSSHSKSLGSWHSVTAVLVVHQDDDSLSPSANWDFGNLRI